MVKSGVDNRSFLKIRRKKRTFTGNRHTRESEQNSLEQEQLSSSQNISADASASDGH